MIGGKSQSSVKPVALGATLQSSTYGQTIPVLFGRTKQSLYVIWAANIRQSGGGKKSKKGGKKGPPPDYYENIDFLIGHNPIVTPLQFWAKQDARYPFNFVKHSGSMSGGVSVTVPDGLFFAVVGVTLSATYSVTFDDYGGQGSQTLSGSWEIPLWNAAYAAPDPGRAGTDRFGKYYYYWQPGSGPTITFPQNANSQTGISGTVNVYYAQLDIADILVYTKFLSSATPMAALNMVFEPVLGDGPEFSGNDNITGAPLNLQQILYPHYAGIGSANYDLGSAQVLPNVRVEILGAYPLYPTGDADFADMIEDIFKMGLAQAALGSAYAYTQIQHGLSCFDFPGSVQCTTMNTVNPFSGPISYYRPNTANNILLVAANAGGIIGGLATFGASPVSDSAGNTWSLALPTGLNAQICYAKAVAASSNAVTITGQTYHWQSSLLEIGGVDTFDNAAYSTTSRKVTILTGNDAGTPCFILAMANYTPDAIISALPEVVQWKLLVDRPNGANDFALYYQVVYQPGYYSFTAPLGTFGTTPNVVALVSFKCAEPPGYPRPLGDILDAASLDLCRQQCRANGLWGSLLMDSQQKAGDWLGDLFTAMNAAPVWSGFTLKCIPLSEVSAVGNGAIYNAPSAAGPVATLYESDFIGGADSPLITVERKAQVDVPNILQYQHPNRSSDYNDVTVSQPETASIALFGPRKDSPKQMRMIQDTGIARMILSIAVRKQNFLRNVYKFKIKAKWKLLEPLDLILINEPRLGISQLPVRLTSVSEDAEYALDCEAEPFIYGCYSPVAVPTTAVAPHRPQVGISPGQVNPPIIFEPVPRLYGALNQNQLWLVVSASNVNYGGCQVYISTDGGVSYNLIGQLQGSATTGVSTADWPAASDPDTTNDLPLDLTESNRPLTSYQTSDEDNFTYISYMAGGNASIPYELLSYAVATLTSAEHYTLKATGTGNKLRRAVFGAPAVGAGVDHPIGTRFAFLGPPGAQAQQGILKLSMDPTWIGKTLHFKFLAFNTNLGALESLSDAVDYTYTPTGTVGSVNPAGASTQIFQINGA
jgi:hypothetical protein